MSRMTTRQPLRTAALAAALALVAADFAAAQRGGGGRGGRGFGPPPVYENEGFQEEVGLTAEQVERLNELREKTRAEVDFGSIRERMQNASEEERGKIREEIGQKFRESQEKFEEQSREVFTEDQRERYDQVRLRSRGTRGLADDDGMAKDLGLSDEQREKMKAARDEIIQEVRESGDWQKFRDPEFREKLDQTALSVMTDDQRQKYEAKLGPEPTYELNGRGGGDRGGTAAGAGTMVSRSAARQSGGTSTRPRPEGATVVADITADGDPAADPDGPGPEPSVANRPTPMSDPVPEDVERMSFSYRFAPWDLVLKQFADFADLTLDPGPVPPGTFNYYDRGRYTPTEALDVLNGYLLQRGVRPRPS